MYGHHGRKYIIIPGKCVVSSLETSRNNFFSKFMDEFKNTFYKKVFTSCLHIWETFPRRFYYTIINAVYLENWVSGSIDSQINIFSCIHKFEHVIIRKKMLIFILMLTLLILLHKKEKKMLLILLFCPLNLFFET